MNSTKFSLLVIRASDMEVALAFYRALGLSFAAEQHGAGPLHYSCDIDGLIFEIYPARAGEASDSVMIGFAVESLNETLAELRELGVEPNSPPKSASWGRFVNVKDGDGRVVQLTQSSFASD